MTKKQVIERLCRLCSDVGCKHFNSQIAHDCFCGGNPMKPEAFCFDEKILKYIEKKAGLRKR